jgi:hypothetical protein
VQSDEFGHLPTTHADIARAWIEQVATRAQQEKIQAAAQQFQNSQNAAPGQGDMGTVGTTIAEPQPGGGGSMTPEMEPGAQPAGAGA